VSLEDEAMRLPAMTIKRWMIVILVAALGMFFLRYRPRSISLGVGSKNVTIDFVVTNADSGQPIEGASIHLWTPDFLESTGLPYTVDLTTGSDGKAKFSVELMTYVHHDLGTGECIFYRVVYPHWEITCVADGYSAQDASFVKVQRENPLFHQVAQPPPIAIRLKK